MIQGVHMCYEKPGPRCSNHCRVDLAKAREAYAKVASAEGAGTSNPQQLTRLHKAKERLAAAKSRYDRTPEGKKSLHEEADKVDVAAHRGGDEDVKGERQDYAAALRAYADHGLESRTKQKRDLRAYRWDQGVIEEKLGGEVLRAERAYDAAAAEVAMTNNDPTARARFQAASEALVDAQDQYYTTKAGQRHVKAEIAALVDEAKACTVARQRDRIVKEARQLKDAQREAWHTRLRQKAAYNAQKDRDRLLNQAAKEMRTKRVAPAHDAAVRKAVPTPRTPEAAPARVGEGAAWGIGASSVTTSPAAQQAAVGVVTKEKPALSSAALADRADRVRKASTQWYASEGDPTNPRVTAKYSYRKDAKSGGWKVLGPRAEMLKSMDDGDGVTVYKKSGETSQVGVGRVSKGFMIDGVECAYADVDYSNMCRTGGDCDSGGSGYCRFCM